MSRKIRFIGDIHGEFYSYMDMINDLEYESIQVGDYGVGFGVPAPVISNNHRFIRGNHDDPAECRREATWIPDGTFERFSDKCLAMFVGGAYSIDKDWRTAGLDWWPNEELSYIEFESIRENYEEFKPDIMVTHAVAESVAKTVLESNNQRFFGLPSITEKAFEDFLTIHQPKLWIFGHYHIAFDRVINGTRFICIPPMEFIDIEFT